MDPADHLKSAVIYARVSTDEQREQTSIQKQVGKCTDFARASGYAIVGQRYVNATSGQDCLPGDA